MGKTISADSQLLTHRTSIFVFALAVSSTVGAQDVKRCLSPRAEAPRLPQLQRPLLTITKNSERWTFLVIPKE